MISSSQTPERSTRPTSILDQSSTVTDTPDIPVDLEGYERNVKTRKVAVGIFSALGLLVTGAIIAKHPINRKGGLVAEWVNVVFLVSTGSHSYFFG